MAKKSNKWLFGFNLGTDVLSFLFLGGLLILVYMGKVDIDFNLNIPVTVISFGLLNSGKSAISNIVRLAKGLI